jgi:hypothetical protein
MSLRERMDLVWSRALKARWAADRIRFAVGEGTIGWWAWEPPPPRVVIIDGLTGVELHREVCAPLKLFPRATGFLTLDVGWRSGDGPAVAPQLVAFMCVDGRVEVERLPVRDGTSLVGAEPRTASYVLARNNWAGPLPPTTRHAWAELWAWGEREPLATWAPRHRPGVDWDSGCIWGDIDPINRPGELVLDAIDGSFSQPLRLPPRCLGVRAVGCGVLGLGHRGIHLFRPGGAALTVLPASPRAFECFQVSDRGRTVRTVLGGKPRRFTIDLDNHLVLDAPQDALRLARAPSRTQLIQDMAWHPTLDRLALVRHWPRCAVYTSDGEFLCQLPRHTRPRAWLAGPDALLAVRQQDEQTAMLELWHTVTS